MLRALSRPTYPIAGLREIPASRSLAGTTFAISAPCLKDHARIQEAGIARRDGWPAEAAACPQLFRVSSAVAAEFEPGRPEFAEFSGGQIHVHQPTLVAILGRLLLPAVGFTGRRRRRRAGGYRPDPAGRRTGQRALWNHRYVRGIIFSLGLRVDSPADNKIVGVRYYNGYATPGETVICRRDAANPVRMRIFGHLRRELTKTQVRFQRNPSRQRRGQSNRPSPKGGRIQTGALPRRSSRRRAIFHAKKSKDRHDITVEAQLIGEKAFYDCPVRLFIYGTCAPAGRADLERRLKADKLVTATELKQTKKANALRRDVERAAMGLKSGMSSVGLGKAGEPEISMADLLKVSQAVDLRKGEDIAKTLAMDEEQLSKMPKAVQPTGLKAQLLPYQLQGLAWLQQKEKPEFPSPGSPDIVQLWKRDARGRYANVATNFTVQQAPQLLSGGILADDMGLGKTLQVISLILTGGSGPTLIVAPVSVMSNWAQQVDRHVHKEHAPRVLVHHGAKKTTSKAELEKYDMVVTSYNTLTLGAGSSPLFSVRWRRVVLDEGHIIRNSRTRTAVAACALNASSRWVLSGTPM